MEYQETTHRSQDVYRRFKVTPNGDRWQRMVKRTGHVNQQEFAHVPENSPTKTDSTGWEPLTRPTGQWQPTCGHGAPVVPATVLDPFVDSGTTCAVAQRLGRRGVGSNPSPDYLKLAAKRIGAITPPMTLGGGQ